MDIGYHGHGRLVQWMESDVAAVWRENNADMTAPEQDIIINAWVDRKVRLIIPREAWDKIHNQYYGVPALGNNTYTTETAI